MGKIEQNKERNKQKILKAAQEVFISEGYVFANMDNIASLAQMTKQSVYRYFPSKIDLFQATLIQMGKNSGGSFFACLKNPDTREALVDFAKNFIRFHLSDEHISTFRLLVAESAKVPEITNSFFTVGHNKTDEVLSSFFSERLNIEETQVVIRLWTGMLLTFRSEVLVGMGKPSKQQIEKHAKDSTDFLFAAIS